MINKKGILFVISGPSGAGKSTIRKEIIKNDNNIWFSISMTTRKPRDGEINGVDYFFVSKEEFIENIKNNNFFEYAQVYNKIYYGTLKSSVLNQINKGIDVILEIDVEGAFNIKKQYKDAVLIFIYPPSIEDLKERLIDRGTDSLSKINERINKANYELSFKNKYDYALINNNLDDAINGTKEIIKKVRKKVK